MNREIKFRVWHKPTKQFVKQDIFYLDEEPSSIGQLSVGLDGTLIQAGMYDDYSAVSDPEDYAIQQYTGLKDSNGVEIYEGDLLLSAFCRDEENPVEVSWGDKNNGWNVNHKNGQEGPLLKIHQQSYEVVGNIFEGVDK
jgi:uncharacterized phage protein (TIGR01671 family)